MRNYPDPSTETRIIHEDYTAGKDEVFVVVLLGTEPKDGSAPLDPVQRLNEMGWVSNQKAETK
jgi:hypothetical protein